MPFRVSVPEQEQTGDLAFAGTVAINNAYDNRDDFLLNMTNRGRGRPSRRRGFDDDFSFDRAPPGDMPRVAPSWPSSAGFGPEHDATVKWFNPEKGFGFVALSDGSGDAFLHANTLNQSGHNAVSPGATLRVRIGQGQKGRQVSEVLSVDESPPRRRPRAAAHAVPVRVVSAIAAVVVVSAVVLGPLRGAARQLGLPWKCKVP